MDGPTRLKPQYSESVVGLLTEALERAKTGEFESIVLVALCHDTTFDVIGSRTDRYTALLGALAQAQFDMMMQKSHQPD